MHRALSLFLLVFFTSSSQSAPPAGSWKITLPASGRAPIVVLVALSESDGKWVGDVIDMSVKLRNEPKIESVSVKDGTVTFGLRMDAGTVLSFEGIVSKDGKTLKGSFNLGGETMRTLDLLPSKLKTLQDSFEVAKESLTQTEDPELALDFAREVLRQASTKKIPPDEVRAMLDRLGKLAAGQGRRWERYSTLKLTEALANQEGYADVALAQARKAERMLTDEDDATVRMSTLDLLVQTLTASHKADEAKPYQRQLALLQAREYQEWSKTNPVFKVEEFKARKAPNDRVVLVELFSNLEFEPSAAIDAAQAALLKAYRPSDVIVLTYHLSLRDGFDPLTTPDVENRILSLQEILGRGQHGFVAGKPCVGISGTTKLKDGETIFKSLVDRVNAELELPAKAKLTLSLTPGKDGYTAKANVTDLATPGEKMVLRFALAEDRIRISGSNGTKFHHMVVRAMPGGFAGFPLKTANHEQVVTVKPTEIKAAIAKHLGEMGSEVSADRVAPMKNLKLVAYIQNDTTGEILTAAQVDVK